MQNRNDDKRLQHIRSKIQMINFDDYANENKTEHNQKWPYTPDHLYRILMIGDSRFEKKCIIEFNK